MPNYTATIKWQGTQGDFLENKYSRAHTWTFDGGLTIPASSSPDVVPEPLSVAANVDPEEAFVASLSSCHMLWFLALAAEQGIAIAIYTDNAVGIMEKNPKGKVAITRVELNPVVVLEDNKRLAHTALENLHHAAHERCFIANSVTSEVIVNLGQEAQSRNHD